MRRAQDRARSARSRKKRAARDENVPAKRADFFLTASYQILKNYAILINYKSLFQGKVSLQVNHLQFSKMNKLLSNSAICL